MEPDVPGRHPERELQVGEPLKGLQEVNQRVRLVLGQDCRRSCFAKQQGMSLRNLRLTKLRHRLNTGYNRHNVNTSKIIHAFTSTQRSHRHIIWKSDAWAKLQTSH